MSGGAWKKDLKPRSPAADHRLWIWLWGCKILETRVKFREKSGVLLHQSSAPTFLTLYAKQCTEFSFFAIRNSDAHLGELVYACNIPWSFLIPLPHFPHPPLPHRQSSAFWLPIPLLLYRLIIIYLHVTPVSSWLSSLSIMVSEALHLPANEILSFFLWLILHCGQAPRFLEPFVCWSMLYVFSSPQCYEADTGMVTIL